MVTVTDTQGNAISWAPPALGFRGSKEVHPLRGTDRRLKTAARAAMEHA